VLPRLQIFCRRKCEELIRISSIQVDQEPTSQLVVVPCAVLSQEEGAR